MLPLLQYWLSSRVNKILMLCQVVNFRQLKLTLFFHVKWKFWWNWRGRPVLGISRKGHLLRFESNSRATSDGCTRKLGNDVRRDSELITTRVCSQISCKWIMTSLDRTSFDFRFEDFLSNLPGFCLYKKSSTGLLTNYPKLDLKDLS